MPTMKDIAEALREASDAYNRLYLSSNKENRPLSTQLHWKTKAVYAKDLATQVEQMRCETCLDYAVIQTKKELITYPMNRCNKIGVSDLGPDFYCKYWKPKEVKKNETRIT